MRAILARTPFAFMSLLFMIVACSHKQSNSDDLIALVVHGDYDGAIAIVERRQTEFDASGLPDDMNHIYLDFKNSDPVRREILEAWIEARPNSHVPHYAMCVYLSNVARHRRGTKYIVKTDLDRLDAMREEMITANAHCLKAIELNQNFALSYVELMSNHAYLGDEETFDAVYKKGVEANPASRRLPTVYLWYQQPKWMGRPDRIRDVLADLATRLAAYPYLEPLMGYPAFLTALVSMENDRTAADVLFDQALEYGWYAYYTNEKAENYYHAKKYRKAERLLREILRNNAEDYSALVYLGRTLFRLEQYAESARLLARASKIDPYDPKLQRWLGDSLRSDGNDEAAKAAYERAIRYHDEGGTRYRIAQIILTVNKDAKASLTHWEHAVAYDPDEPAYWYGYAYALMEARECEFVGAVETYFQVCAADSDCDGKIGEWMKDFIPEVRRIPSCSAIYGRDEGS